MKENTIFAILILLISGFNVSAQAPFGAISGRLQDSITRRNLPFATVTVFKATDTAIVTYRMSDLNGNFRVPSLPLNEELRVLITFTGYKVFRREFRLSEGTSALEIGTILLTNDPKLLEEVLVYRERPPVIVRNDTIEFNVGAFKTLPSALLQDLLKKLPGIHVDFDGNITVKGKSVNRLLVDGKEFFGADPKIATKNLPANIVDKVQVMDDREQLERNPDVSAADLGQVINIKLKRSIKDGWFGKLYAGQGTDKRHEGGLILNAFRDTTQISILAFSNNINQPGFGISDLQKIGGFNRSGMNGVAVYSGGGVAINGISFGGTGQGIQRSFGGGANLNHQFGTALTVNLQYFYGEVNSEYEAITNRQRFFGDTIQVIRTESVNKSKDESNRLGGTAIWKIDSFTTITFRPGLTLNRIGFNQHSTSMISDNSKGQLNFDNNQQNGVSKKDLYSHNLFLTKNFHKRGRTFSLSQSFSNTAVSDDQYYDFVNQSYVNPTTIKTNQFRRRNDLESVNSITANFSEPLSKMINVRLQHTLERLTQDNVLNPYNRNAITDTYSDLIDSVQSGIDRKLGRSISNIGFSWRKDLLAITSTINQLWVSIKNDYFKSSSINRTYYYVYPSFNMRYKDLSFNYNSSINIPSATDMQPVPDNTNRQFVFIGNPNLKPSISKSVTFNYYKFSQKGYSLNANLSGQTRKNAIVLVKSVDGRGIETSRPENINGLKGLTFSANYSTQQTLFQKVKLSIRPSLVMGYNKNALLFNGYRTNSISKFSNSSINALLNFNDKVEINNRYSISVSGISYNEQRLFPNTKVITQSAESEIVIRYPHAFVWENIINYSHNSNVAPGINKNALRWNSAINYQFLRDGKGQLRLSVFDLLNRNITIFRLASENYIFDSQTTTLQRYLMVSFIYNIRTFGFSKVGGKDRTFFSF